jgi:hypothetical protein
METTENPTTEAKKSLPRNYVSIDQWIGKMKLTFGNATLPEIFSVMQTVGYTNERIASLIKKLERLENLQQVRTKEYAEQITESDEFDSKCTELYVQYSTHRKLAKILFKGDTLATKSLRLDQTSKRTYSGWYEEATNFYAQLAASPELLTKAGGVGITTEVVDTQKQALVDLQSLKVSQRKETAEAQQATAARDKAFDELYPLYAEYVKYAKVLLEDNKALVALGIIVK